MPPYRTIPSPEEPRILGCSWVRRMGFGVRARGLMTVLASLRKLKDFFMVIKCF